MPAAPALRAAAVATPAAGPPAAPAATAAAVVNPATQARDASEALPAPAKVAILYIDSICVYDVSGNDYIYMLLVCQKSGNHGVDELHIISDLFYPWPPEMHCLWLELVLLRMYVLEFYNNT